MYKPIIILRLYKLSSLKNLKKNSYVKFEKKIIFQKLVNDFVLLCFEPSLFAGNLENNIESHINKL